jgi:hypothetical protein
MAKPAWSTCTSGGMGSIAGPAYGIIVAIDSWAVVDRRHAASAPALLHPRCLWTPALFGAAGCAAVPSSSATGLYTAALPEARDRLGLW